jgi:hypothetical protein
MDKAGRQSRPECVRTRENPICVQTAPTARLDLQAIGDRASVLSLGSPSADRLDLLKGRNVQLECISHLAPPIRYLHPVFVACCTKWVRDGLMHAVAR